MDEMSRYPIGRLLSMAARRVEHSWERVLREHGLTSAGLVVLHVLAERTATQRDIARACGVTDQTASRTTERLERLGYVSRRVDPGDERRKTVAITPDGRRVYEALLDRERTDPGLTAAVGDDEPVLRRLLIALIQAEPPSDPTE
jgi:MarR family transcriptional regulator, organic hydroperoxide resistance regulator